MTSVFIRKDLKMKTVINIFLFQKAPPLTAHVRFWLTLYLLEIQHIDWIGHRNYFGLVESFLAELCEYRTISVFKSFIDMEKNIVSGVVIGIQD